MADRYLGGLCLITVLLLPFCQARAQTSDRAELRGRVMDETGAILSGVSLTLRSSSTGHRYETVSTGRGNFAYPFLPPGSYTLTAARPGFSTLVMESIRVAVNQAVEVPLVLTVGGPASQITVSAAAGGVETTNSAIKYRLSEKAIGDLPVLTGSDGRHLLSTVVFLVPGASNIDMYNTPLTSYLSINGSPSGGVAFSTDGVDGTSMGNWAFSVYRGGSLSNGPNPDAVQEFSSVSQTFNADSGTRSVLLNIETRSGSNNLHGQVRGLLLNPDLAARDFFDLARKSAWTTTMLGAQLSAPVVIPGVYQGRDRTLFFLDQENSWSRFTAGSRAIPTLSNSARDGDFSGLPPSQWPIDPRTGTPFPGGRIPRERVLSQSRLFVDQIIRPPDQGSSVLTSSPADDGNSQITSRVDHQFSPSDTLNASGFWEWRRYSEPSPLAQEARTRIPMGGNTFAVHHTHTFAATTVNCLTFGGTRARHEVYYDGKYNDVDLKQAVFNITRNTEGRTGYPNVRIEGYYPYRPGSTDYLARESTWSAKDALSLSRGSHSLGIGVEMRWLRGRSYDNDSGAPLFYFSQYSPSGTGNAIANFLLGIPDSYSQSTDATNHPRRRLLSLYLQDSVKIRPNLTVNIGLRYEVAGAWTESDGRNAAFRPGARSEVFPSAPAGAIFAGDRDPITGKLLERNLTPVDRDNFGPRVGIAYAPAWGGRLFGGAGRSSIRAGYGIYYIFSRANAIRMMANMPPWYYQANRDRSQLTRSGGTFLDPWGSDPDPFAGLLSGVPFPLPLSNVPFVAPAFSEPYQHQWTLSFQRQLPANLVAEVAYLGNSALHLPRGYEANPGLLTSDANPFNVNSRRQYPDFGSTPGYASDGVSSYHSMQLGLGRRLASSLLFNLDFVWAKALDNAGGNFFDKDFGDRDIVGWARADFDRRHKFVFLGVWEVPKVPAGKVLGTLVSGWQLNAVVHLNSGLPLQIRNLYDSSLRGSITGWPDIIRSFRKLNPREIHTFRLPNGQTQTGNFLFDPGVFRTVLPTGPREARPGTLGRNAFTGHGINNTDISVLRRFSLTERQQLVFRADISNLFNHAQFAMASGAHISPSPIFGTSNLTFGARRIQFLLRYSF